MEETGTYTGNADDGLMYQAAARYISVRLEEFVFGTASVMALGQFLSESAGHLSVRLCYFGY